MRIPWACPVSRRAELTSAPAAAAPQAGLNTKELKRISNRRRLGQIRAGGKEGEARREASPARDHRESIESRRAARTALLSFE